MSPPPAFSVTVPAVAFTEELVMVSAPCAELRLIALPEPAAVRALGAESARTARGPLDVAVMPPGAVIVVPVRVIGPGVALQVVLELPLPHRLTVPALVVSV